MKRMMRPVILCVICVALHFASAANPLESTQNEEDQGNQQQATDCKALLDAGSTFSGLDQIYVNRREESTQVYCDQDRDGGGWLVIQRRTDGFVDFYRNWEDYRRGFGDKNQEFWLGLDMIHAITNDKAYELRIDMEDFYNHKAYAKYSTFRVGAPSDNYRLEVGGYQGDAGDSLAYHNGQPFTTKDRDHDAYDAENCAIRHIGAWWYKTCHKSNLNGAYRVRRINDRYVNWFYWRNSFNSLKRVDMKIRPVNLTGVRINPLYLVDEFRPSE